MLATLVVLRLWPAEAEPVVANVAPRLCADLQEATLAGDYARALTIQDRLYPLQSGLFAEANPAPVKYALSRLGHMTDELRLPLVPVTEPTKRIVDDALRHAGLLVD